jgi:class 3 adenylate cyclase/tetratricopeptide (TPR) repeat protein
VQRKVVTVLFCDIVGSTARGETLDPEALESLLTRYFERMKRIVEHHGGCVEKFIGDAVMAVFGIPAAHEDDALRACRAGMEMRTESAALDVDVRVGVNTGEVVTGTDERLATGDAVNLAARLQQAAEAGEVLIGESTRALVRDTAELEPLAPLMLKGKADPVQAWRLVAVRERPERRHDTVFVGRERELELLAAAWHRSQTHLSCELVTIVGEAGVGKSRLVAEALETFDGRVVRTRCLPYGDGITYWPVVDVLRQLAPSEPPAPLRSLLDESGGLASTDEIAWAFRRLIEQHAPLVVVVEDLQWAEDTFLDLLESLPHLSTGAPLLLLGTTRAHLLDRRPAWPESMRLEPLGDDEMRSLLVGRLPNTLRQRVLRQAGGNPLFAEEMVALAREGDSDVDVPPTLRALLAARLDQLDPRERTPLAHGAVEGELFHRGAVQVLTPDEDQLMLRLAALVRHGLVRPDRSQFSGDDAFRFRHVLLRDAAYEALPKAVRADLHERFARWLGDHPAELAELDEIRGHHLEQAARCRADLGLDDANVALEAAALLAAAGRRAWWRDDRRTAARLFARALSLGRPHRFDLHLELAALAVELEPAQQEADAAAAAARAAALGDEAGEGVLLLMRDMARVLLGESVDSVEFEERAHRLVSVFEARGDDETLVHVWDVVRWSANFRMQYEEFARAAEAGLAAARRAGWRFQHAFRLETALVAGPRPADEALATLDAVLPDDPTPETQAERALLLAILGRFAEARAIMNAAAEHHRELGGDGLILEMAEIAAYEGDHAAAASYLGAFCADLADRGMRANLSTFAPKRGYHLCRVGEFAEAERLAELGRELGDPADIATQGLWRHVLAHVLAQRGEHEEAERLAREAVEIFERTDSVIAQGFALDDLGEVLDAAGRTTEAIEVWEDALARFERKRNVAMARQLTERITAARAGEAPARATRRSPRS